METIFFQALYQRQLTAIERIIKLISKNRGTVVQPSPKANTLNPANSVIQSLSKMAIQPRSVKFTYNDIKQAFFFDNNGPISAFWVGLSSIFPLGEQEFINSVMLFKDQVTDEKLKQELMDFAKQEAEHAVQHRKLNSLFENMGYSINKIEDFTRTKIQERVNTWTPAQRLARTVAAEHVTAVFAHFALTKPHTMNNIPESFRHLLQWHAIEEIEHKSVAFDVYKHCVGDMKALRRQYRHFAFFEFPMNMRGITKRLLKDLHHKSSRDERKRMWTYLFGKDGMLSSMKHLYWMFNKKDFHPWQHDDSTLVEEWKIKLASHINN